MTFSNGLIVINSNCNITKDVENYIKKIYEKGTTGVIYCENKEDLQDVITNEDHIIVFGGDGTVSSVLQHVIHKNIPVIHFPTGTGNGLINSLLNLKNMKVEKNLNITHDYMIDSMQKEEDILMDTMTIKLLNSMQTYHSFLFISCGIFANLDLKSEWLRSLGEFRFTLGAVTELLQYMMLGNSFEGTLEFVDEIDRELKIEGNFVFFLASNLSHTSASSITSPKSNHNDGYIYLSYLTQPVSTFELLKLLLSLEDGSYVNKLIYLRTKKFKLTPKQKSGLVYDFDGESFEIEPIEVSINPESFRVII